MTDAAAGRTIGEAIEGLARAFAAAGIEDARTDARLLVAAATGLDRTGLLLGRARPLDPSAAARLDAMAERRLAREPVSRILGRRGFWTLDLEIGPEVLDPRPDTETVVEAVLARVSRERPVSVLDLGTGSGAILLALLDALPQARGVGVDRSFPAAARAAANARAAGLARRAAFLCGSWGDALAGRFDVVVSNPPYLRTAELEQVAPEVGRYDPRLALDGGRDGLDAYRHLAAALPDLLLPGGLVALEVGAGQSDDVAALLVARGLGPTEIVRDLADIRRCVLTRS